MNASKLHPLSAAQLLAICGAGELAAADLPPAPGAEATLQEVLVTAQRRQQLLQEVPISMSVLSAAALEQRQIEDVSGLQYSAPNLTVVPWPGSHNRANIAMRGQTEPDRFPTLDPAVGVYLDGVYIARTGGANLDLVDIERVEVLRGPQGTLFGRNTIGGAINVIPHTPTFSLEGSLMAGVGNYDRHDFRGIVNVPLAADSAALRVAAWHSSHDGYGRNTLLDRDLNADDRSFVRTQLRFASPSRWDLNLSFDYTDGRADTDLLTLLAVHPPLTQVPASVGNPDDRLESYADPHARSIRANRSGGAESKVWGAAGTLAIDFENVTLKTIAAYRSLDTSDEAADLDGTPYDLFTVFGRDESQHQSSLELQALGDALDGRLDWIGGLLYFAEGASFTESFQALDPITLVAVENLPRGQVNNESAAVYGQLMYSLTSKLRLTAGARFNQDRRQLTSHNARRRAGSPETCTLDPAVRDAPDLCQTTLPTRTFSYVPWTVGIDFKPTQDVLLFARISKGHRAGGYNFRGTTELNLDTFEPERVTAYEIGARLELFAHRLRFELSCFQSSFEDMQLRERASAPGTLLSLALTSNAGESRIRGGELEIAAVLGTLRLAGAFGVTDAQYTKLDPDVLDVTSDSQFLNTPATTASFAADLPVRFSFADIDLHADYSWRDEVPFAYDPASPARQDAYGLLNAILVVRPGSANLEFRLWGRNLNDERYLVRATDSGFLVTALPGNPRTFGVSMTYRFAVR